MGLRSLTFIQSHDLCALVMMGDVSPMESLAIFFNNKIFEFAQLVTRVLIWIIPIVVS